MSSQNHNVLFRPISEIIEAKKTDMKAQGNFRAVVISATDIKSGTNPRTGQDWRRRTFTVQNGPDTLDITAWGGDVTRLEIGAAYEFVKLWWHKDKYDKTVVGFGKYALITKIDGTKVAATSAPASPPVATASAAAPPRPTYVPPEVPWTPECQAAVDRELGILLRIEKRVREAGPPGMGDPLVGMLTKEIYRAARADFPAVRGGGSS